MIEIRRLTPEDAGLWRDIRLEALALEPEQFSSRHADWVDRPLADFAARLEAAPVWAAIEAGRAVAVASLSPDADGAPCGWVVAVYVRPGARGRGLAQAALAAVEAEARAQGLAELRLEVRAANAAARGLYQRLGFRQEGDGARRTCGLCEVGMVKPL